MVGDEKRPGDISYELVGGGPQDGETGLLDFPFEERRYPVPVDVYYVQASSPTATELFHMYRLDTVNGDKARYRYEGYTT